MSAARDYDVVAIRTDQPRTVRIIEQRLDLEDAKAIIGFACYRRGTEAETFARVPTGMYRNGDTWRGNGRQ